MPSYVRAGIRKCARIRALSISRGKTELLCRFTELFRLIIINTCRKLNYHCHSNHYFLSFYILLTCFANIPYLDY